MKRVLLILLTLLLALSLFASCGKEKNTVVEEFTDRTASPAKEYKDAKDLIRSGAVPLEVPESVAPDAKYYLIAGDVSNIQFAWEERNFDFRTASGERDYRELLGITDVNEDDLIAMNAVIGDQTTDILVYHAENGTLGTWYIDGNTYTVFTPDKIEDAAFCALCNDLFVSAHDILEK